MHIGIAGPIATESIARFIDNDCSQLPVGYSGAPLLGTLIGELLSRGHQVSAYTTSADLPLDLAQPVVAAGKQFKIFYCPQRKHSLRMNGRHCGRIVDFFGLERRYLEQAIRMDAPDVVHAHWAYEFALAAMASDLPYLVTAHDDPREVLKLYKNVYRFGRYLMARRVLRRATAISAVSPDLKRRLQPHTTSSIDVISNPLAEKFSNFEFSKRHITEKNKLKIVSVVNGWGYLKNVESALTAFALVRQKVVGVTYHLYGSDFQPGGPAQLWAITNKLDTDVFFHGKVQHEALIPALSDASLMIHPSRSESCPMGIAEAMALGVPVIGGEKSGGVPWMVGDGGILVNINESLEIANAALKILSDVELYRAYALAARNRIDDFRSENIASKYEEKYLSILSGKNRK
jgi:glycosyltransferase involved in cell wall biosynthesis